MVPGILTYIEAFGRFVGKFLPKGPDEEAHRAGRMGLGTYPSLL